MVAEFTFKNILFHTQPTIFSTSGNTDQGLSYFPPTHWVPIIDWVEGWLENSPLLQGCNVWELLRFQKGVLTKYFQKAELML